MSPNDPAPEGTWVIYAEMFSSILTFWGKIHSFQPYTSKGACEKQLHSFKKARIALALWGLISSILDREAKNSSQLIPYNLQSHCITTHSGTCTETDKQHKPCKGSKKKKKKSQWIINQHGCPGPPCNISWKRCVAPTATWSISSDRTWWKNAAYRHISKADKPLNVCTRQHLVRGSHLGLCGCTRTPLGTSGRDLFSFCQDDSDGRRGSAPEGIDSGAFLKWRLFRMLRNYSAFWMC